MPKQTYIEALHQLRHARSDHIQWRSFANALSTGIQLDITRAPINAKECEFGKWYYSLRTQQFFAEYETFESIKAPHEVLHQIYSKIYTACANKKTKEANILLIRLNQVSTQLLEAIDLLEKELRQKILEAK